MGRGWQEKVNAVSLGPSLLEAFKRKASRDSTHDKNTSSAAILVVPESTLNH